MGKCIPGTPCYKGNDVIVYTTYPKGCSSSSSGPFSVPISSDNLYYSGSNQSNTGINTLDSITTSLQKINEVVDPENMIASIIQVLNNNPTLKAALCEALSDCS